MLRRSLLIGTIALLTACTATQPIINSAEKISTKPIVVGVDDDYPPFDFFENGQATGFDVDLLREIGKRQNLSLYFEPTHWDNMVPHLEQKKIQIALSGFAYSDERAEQYQVSNAYAYGQDTIVTVGKLSDTTPKTLQDLANLKVITLGNSPYIEELETVKGKGNPDIIGVNSSLAILTELIAGKAQAGLTDKAVAQYYMQSLKDANLTLTSEGDYFTKYPLVFVAHKDEAELMQKINAGLAKIIKDGTYAIIYKKWFGELPEELPAAK